MYFCPDKPSSSEVGTYSRRDTLFVFPRKFTWRWKYSGGWVAPVNHKLRAVIDGIPNGEWVLPANNEWIFTCEVADGHHVFDVEGVSSGDEVLKKPFIVNESDAPLPEQKPYTYRLRFEDKQKNLGKWLGRVAFTEWKAPPVYKLKPRVTGPLPERVPRERLWTTPIQKHNGVGLLREWAQTDKGDICVMANNRYFYSDVEGAGDHMPMVPLRDGTRGFGTIGHVVHTHINPDTEWTYFCDVLGRVGAFRRFDGYVVTIAGLRNKPGVVQPHISLKATNPEFYKSCFEQVGDWSRVVGPVGFNEPWAVVPLPDHRMPGFHEFLVFDSLNHRIVYLNHLSAHGASGHAPPLYAPPGYVAPEHPTGKTDVFEAVTLASLGMPFPGQLLDEPWGATLNPVDGRVYWTNYNRGSICSMLPNCTDIRLEIDSKFQYGNASLGISKRLRQSKTPASMLRAQYLRDGGPGEATIIRPQSIEFASDGKLIFAERYTFAIREFDPATKRIRTLATMPYEGTGFGELDVTLVVDHTGSFGGKDDIFTIGWWGKSFRRFTREGVDLGEPWQPKYDSMTSPTGPLAQSHKPGYAWMLAIGHGKRAGTAIVGGGAGGWQAYEVSLRQPDETDLDYARFDRGYMAFHFGDGRHEPMALTHGHMGQGLLGKPQVWEMGSWADERLAEYLTAHGIDPTLIVDTIYFIRRLTIDIDYTVAEPPPPPPPPPPPQPDMTFSVNGRLYEVREVGGSEVDDDDLLINGVGYRVVPVE